MDRTKAQLNRYEAVRLKEKWGIDAIQVRYRETGDWYATLKYFPAALFDRHGYFLFPTKKAYRNPPKGFYIGKEIGVPKGISAFPGYRPFATEELGNIKLFADIKKIRSSRTLDETTKKRLVDARLGQGRFGSAVRELWNHQCAVTGSSTTATLEASHIKCWADSKNNERLDSNNGLLLTANLHRLFDAGLISFEDSGELRVSSKLLLSEQKKLGVVRKQLSKRPSAETAKYLAYHRKFIFH